MSIFRCYLFNLATRQEMKDHPYNGKTWMATSGMAVDANGKFIPDTCVSVTLAEWSTMRAVKGERTFTADDFDHPVAIKVWFGPGKDGGKPEVEWRRLVKDAERTLPVGSVATHGGL